MALTIDALERRKNHDHGEVDQEIVRRLSALDEARVLVFFWYRVGLSDERLALLLVLSHVVVTRPPTWSYGAIRHAHEQGHGYAGAIHLTRDRCFACEGGPRLYWHHVVEVQHGGSNAARNQVPLCFDCHQYLHPWLVEPPRVRPGAFESFADLTLRRQ